MITTTYVWNGVSHGIRQKIYYRRYPCLTSSVFFGISYLAPASKFILRVLGSRGCAQRAQDLYWFRQNIPTSNHYGLRHWHH
jgi:hypothetical protein